jgi:hypothetical protein
MNTFRIALHLTVACNQYYCGRCSSKLQHRKKGEKQKKLDMKTSPNHGRKKNSNRSTESGEYITKAKHSVCNKLLVSNICFATENTHEAEKATDSGFKKIL